MVSRRIATSWRQRKSDCARRFRDDGFRGCAFINRVGELGEAMPEVIEITRQHKQEMAATIASVLPPSRQRLRNAQAIALAADGAIIRAQFDETPGDALLGLGRILKSLLIKKLPQKPRQR